MMHKTERNILSAAATALIIHSSLYFAARGKKRRHSDFLFANKRHRLATFTWNLKLLYVV